MQKLFVHNSTILLKVLIFCSTESLLTIIHYLLDALELYSATFGRGNGSILERIDCSGSELRVIDCRIINYPDYFYCDHTEDAGVRCCKYIVILYLALINHSNL